MSAVQATVSKRLMVAWAPEMPTRVGAKAGQVEGMYRVAIVEDSAEDAAQLARLLHSSAYADALDTPQILSDAQAVAQLSAPPDILFVDARLGSDVLTGIDMIEAMNGAWSMAGEHAAPQVIYVSAYLSFAPEVYRTNHTWFLAKPVDPTLLNEALGRAVAQIEAGREEPLAVHQRGAVLQVLPRRIRYVESNLRKIKIHEGNRVIEVYGRLAEVARQLPSNRFVRCHKSYLVNLAYVAELGAHELTLDDATVLPVSRRAAPTARLRRCGVTNR